ncbi:hypothetical protein HHUSO_G33985 [Huso huso]|uniref:Uncharacterized protein n=1 Tax=Huso huso TaxID=61971 RepID=A0ABR0Y703_HUSHU
MSRLRGAINNLGTRDRSATPSTPRHQVYNWGRGCDCCPAQDFLRQPERLIQKYPKIVLCFALTFASCVIKPRRRLYCKPARKLDTDLPVSLII